MRRTAAVTALFLAGPPLAGSPLDDAVALHQAGRLDEALEAYREIARSGAGARERSAALNNACVLLNDRGSSKEALPDCAEATRLRREIPDRTLLAQALANWSLALQATGDRGAATQRLREALELDREVGDVEAVVIDLANLAALETENGRYGEALDRLAAAEIELDRARDAPWAEEQLRVLRLNRAVVLERLGAWKESLALLSELYHEPNPDRLGRATLRMDLAVAYRNLGDPRTADRLLLDLIDDLRARGERGALTDALLNLGIVAEMNLRDGERAARIYDEVVELARGGGDRVAEVQALVGKLRLAVASGDRDAAAELSRDAIDASSALGDPETGWAALDAAARAARLAGDTELALDHWLAALDVLDEIRARGGNPTARAGFLTDKRGLFAAAIDLACRRALASGEREHVARALAIVQRAKARELLDAAGVQREPLGPAEISTLAAAPLRAIAFYLGESSVWRFELGGGALRLEDRGDVRSIVELAGVVHERLAHGRADRAMLAELGDRLLSGLDSGAEQLALAPDGLLRYLPLDALPFDGGPPLAERVDTFSLPSVSFLAAHSMDAPEASLAYLGFAPTSGVFDPRSRGGVLAARFALSPLPESGREIVEFARTLPGETLTRTGAAATLARLRSDLENGSRVLHFAAHTVIDDRLGGQGSAIFLAPEASDENLLTPELIAELPLEGTLILLSGCSTALGSSVDGEALTTLTGSFLAAGASGVVASLWEVGDRPSAAFMAQIADELSRGATPAAALRRAKLRLRSAPGGESTSIWAPWILVGNAKTPFPSRPRILSWWLAVAAVAAAAAAVRDYFAEGFRKSSTGSERATRAPATS